MNLNMIINMILRQFVRRGVNAGINAAIAAGRGRKTAGLQAGTGRTSTREAGSDHDMTDEGDMAEVAPRAAAHHPEQAREDKLAKQAAKRASQAIRAGRMLK